jgi:putative FmdB family regulatory protein
MPIYAYRCSSCGHAKDVLQKISDPVLSTCPACGQESFAKQLTAAGFQLKGSGWYVTDFRGGNNAGAPAAKDGAAPSASSTASSTSASPDAPASGGSGAGAGSSEGGAGSSGSSTTTASSAGGCGSACACH